MKHLRKDPLGPVLSSKVLTGHRGLFNSNETESSFSVTLAPLQVLLAMWGQ